VTLGGAAATHSFLFQQIVSASQPAAKPVVKITLIWRTNSRLSRLLGPPQGNSRQNGFRRVIQYEEEIAKQFPTVRCELKFLPIACVTEK
jgi:hypothetical protein